MKNRIKNIVKKQDVYMSVLGCLILFIFYLRHLSELVIPSILLDEMGYWASAAYFKGYNWSGVMGNFSAYYSYGYSLVLYFIMCFIDKPELMHQLAIVINVIMIMGIYLLSVRIVKSLFPNKKSTVYYVACFTALFYPSVQYHSQVAWSEIYLLFMFILSVYLAIKIFDYPSLIKQIAFILTIFNLYIIHQRSLGILIIGILYIIFINRYNKKLIYGVAAIGALFALLYLGQYVKDEIYQNVYTDTLIIEKAFEDTDRLNHNDFGGQIVKIKYFFTVEGFYNFCVSYLGKLWYFGLASFFIGFHGLVRLMKDIFYVCQKKQLLNSSAVVEAYILVSYLATAGVAALFMIYPSRWDTVAYGRYTDWIGIIIITVGILDMFEKKEKSSIHKLFLYIGLSAGFLVVFLNYATQYSISGFFASCSQIMLYFKNIDESNFIVMMTLTIITVGFIIHLLGDYRKDYTACLMMIVLWTVITKPGIDELIVIERRDWVEPIVEYIEEKEYDSIYYLYSEETTFTENAYVGNIQFLLQEKPIRCVMNTQEIQEDDACIIAGWSVPVSGGYKIELDAGVYRIFLKNTRKL